MLTVYVKHYLTPDGIHFFKNKWFPEVHSIISQQEGFVSIAYTTHQNSSDCMNITLKFKDEKTLNDWIAVPIHDDLIKALDAYRSRDFWEAAKTDNDHAEPSTLEWTIIKPSLSYKPLPHV